MTVAGAEEEKVALLEADARQGVPRAQRHLANRYLRGRGVPRDPARGAYWMSRAAEQGLALAQRGLGELYEHGLGVARDLERARRCYEAAAAQGDPVARAHLERLAR